MRLDLYLKLMGVGKTRMEAKRLCDKGMVLLSGKALKPSHELSGGEILDLSIPGKEKKIKVLSLPSGNSVSKKDRPQFVEFIGEDFRKV